MVKSSRILTKQSTIHQRTCNNFTCKNLILNLLRSWQQSIIAIMACQGPPTTTTTTTTTTRTRTRTRTTTTTTTEIYYWHEQRLISSQISEAPNSLFIFAHQHEIRPRQTPYGCLEGLGILFPNGFRSNIQEISYSTDLFSNTAFEETGIGLTSGNKMWMAPFSSLSWWESGIKTLKISSKFNEWILGKT